MIMLYLSTIIRLLCLGPVTSLGVMAAPVGTNPMQLGHLSLPQGTVHELDHTLFHSDLKIKRFNANTESGESVDEPGFLPKRSEASTESGESVDEPGDLPR